MTLWNVTHFGGFSGPATVMMDVVMNEGGVRVG